MSINGDEFTSSINEYTLTFNDYDNHTVKVRAVGDDRKFLSSDYSKILTYKREEIIVITKLSTPNGLTKQNGSLIWNAVPYASSYKVRVTTPDEEISYYDTINRSFLLIGEIEGIYSISVMAISSNEAISDSNYSNTYSYEVMSMP